MTHRPPGRPDGRAGDTAIVRVLLSAYRAGAFPMADVTTGEIRFYTADPRGVLPLDEHDGLHVPRSVDRTLRRGRFMLASDRDFPSIVRGCAAPRAPGEEAWINEDIVRWYTAMHRAGYARCVGAYRPDPSTGRPVLVGGIYGVSIGSAFFGESMFHAPRPRTPDGRRDELDGSDASKVCLVALARHLGGCGYTLFDTQMVTGHVRRFGAREIDAAAYRLLLDDAVRSPPRWRPFPVVPWRTRPDA